MKLKYITYSVQDITRHYKTLVSSGFFPNDESTRVNLDTNAEINRA